MLQTEEMYAEDAASAASQHETITLWPDQAPIGDGSYEKSDATITVYHPQNPNGTAVVICPGGGYKGQVMGGEGHGIAKWLGQHGITGVVLKYRLPNHRPYVPLLDAQQAIRITRAHSEEWKLNVQRIGIIGFSAGGHLTSTLGVHYDYNPPADGTIKNAVANVSARPDFMILIYPVIGMTKDFGHQGSRTNLMGPDENDALSKFFSSQLHVTANTPPAFLAHAVDDKVVPIAHSKVFAEALAAKGVKVKLMELPDGGHGLNGYKGTSWDAWQAGSLQWLAELDLVPKAP